MALKSLRAQFEMSVSAGEAAIRVNTDEMEDAISTIVKACEKHGWPMRVWDHATGVEWCANATAQVQISKGMLPPTKANPTSMAELMEAAAESGSAPTLL